jgi:alkanesulfonate monooxygenase SsuD/methylene tetrahydromethanopterin reductase-like flavin-dependent oxidoreductase (luciferase family)
MKIYSPAMTARVFAAIESVLMSNNGYADIGNNTELAQAVEAAGFTVIHTTNLHGCPTYKASTARAQAALAVSPFGVAV